MTMTILWTGMVVLSILCGLATGQSAQVAAAAVEAGGREYLAQVGASADRLTWVAVATAALDGAAAAVELCLSIAGMLCLWTGVMEVMRRSGLAEKLSRLLRPMLRLLFPQVARDRETMDSIAANVSANLLGLGNAATPLGLEAARRMSRCSPGVASDALCMLVVCNTASIQLIPTTVATVRAGAGSAAPFDILPAVWLASGLSVGVGVLACKICARIWRD